MPEDETAHMRLIHRWLRGETVDGAVGIRLRRGPFDGRIHIVQLDAAGNPPPTMRGRRGPSPAWHVYILVPEPNENSSWIYVYDGAQPVEPEQDC